MRRANCACGDIVDECMQNPNASSKLKLVLGREKGLTFKFSAFSLL
jgi:hypothetical protein